MAYYSPERKEAILQQMAATHSLTVAELASHKGISPATFFTRYFLRISLPLL
jgi:transposase-like protein